MAVIYFDAFLIAPATDLLDIKAFPYAGGFTRSTVQETTTRRLAGGRVRAIRRQGTTRRWTLTLPAVTRDQAEWLEQHTGTLMLFREPATAPHAGRKLYGVYAEVAATEHTYDAESEVSLTIDEVTYTEAAT